MKQFQSILQKLVLIGLVCNLFAPLEAAQMRRRRGQGAGRTGQSPRRVARRQRPQQAPRPAVPRPAPAQPAPTLQPPAPLPGEPSVKVAKRIYGRAWVVKKISEIQNPARKLQVVNKLKWFKKPTPEQQVALEKWIQNETLSPAEVQARTAYLQSATTSTAALFAAVLILIAVATAAGVALRQRQRSRAGAPGTTTSPAAAARGAVRAFSPGDFVWYNQEVWQVEQYAPDGRVQIKRRLESFESAAGFEYLTVAESDLQKVRPRQRERLRREEGEGEAVLDDDNDADDDRVPSELLRGRLGEEPPAGATPGPTSLGWAVGRGAGGAPISERRPMGEILANITAAPTERLPIMYADMKEAFREAMQAVQASGKSPVEELADIQKAIAVTQAAQAILARLEQPELQREVAAIEGRLQTYEKAVKPMQSGAGPILADIPQDSELPDLPGAGSAAAAAAGAAETALPAIEIVRKVPVAEVAYDERLLAEQRAALASSGLSQVDDDNPLLRGTLDISAAIAKLERDERLQAASRRDAADYQRAMQSWGRRWQAMRSDILEHPKEALNVFRWLMERDIPVVRQEIMVNVDVLTRAEYDWLLRYLSADRALAEKLKRIVGAARGAAAGAAQAERVSALQRSQRPASQVPKEDPDPGIMQSLVSSILSFGSGAGASAAAAAGGASPETPEASEDVTALWQKADEAVRVYIAQVEQALGDNKIVDEPATDALEALGKVYGALATGSPAATADDLRTLREGISGLVGEGREQGIVQEVMTQVTDAAREISNANLKIEVAERNLGKVDQSLLRSLGIEPDAQNVYNFLGFDNTAGPDQSFEVIMAAIERKEDELRGRYDQQKLNMLFRQLAYLFRTKLQKDRYDAFIAGRGIDATIGEAQAGRQGELLVPLMMRVLDIREKMRDR